MQDIKTYISEAISSRNNSAGLSYTMFPSKRMEKEQIVTWLETNGFKFTQRQSSGSMEPGNDLIQHYDHTGEMCYTLGAYDQSLGNTQYILFYDSHRMFLIYTCSAMYLPPKTEPVSSLNHPIMWKCELDKFKYTSMKEIQRYFE